MEKTVTYAFNIDMLDSQIVTFSGDTASATLDIQVGKGPNAPSINGLVKIGDTLTMVVTVEGDPGFDVQVQDCIAHDGNKDNAVTLTDSRGCVLKKKLMGPWQKEKKASSLVAFSFFQAFKFPDQMEVFLECNVELCKNGCDICPDDASLVRYRNSSHLLDNFSTNDSFFFNSLTSVAETDEQLIVSTTQRNLATFVYAVLSASSPTKTFLTLPILVLPLL